MVKKFCIKQPKPSATTIGKPQEKIVFGFSELRSFSYIDNHNDASFFISFLERLKKLCSLDWNTANTSARHSFGMEKMLVDNLTAAAKQHGVSWCFVQQAITMYSLVIVTIMYSRLYSLNTTLAMFILMARNDTIWSKLYCYVNS